MDESLTCPEQVLTELKVQPILKLYSNKKREKPWGSKVLEFTNQTAASSFFMTLNLFAFVDLFFI